MKTIFYILGFLITTLFFIFLFSTPIFGNINILFYRGIVILFFACCLSIFFQLILRKHKFFNSIDKRDITVIITLTFSLNLVFFTLVPVTIDRSVSVFILEFLNNRKYVS